MTNVGFLDVCRFVATSEGTGDFVVNAAVTGYQTPTSAGAVNGTVYRYRAESSDLTEWEVGYGTYTSGTTTLARTTVLFSSTGAKVDFTAAPQVAVVFLAEDFNATGQIPGTSTNDTATAGNIGEIISSSVAVGSAVSLTTATPANVTSISVTAGDWEIRGQVYYLFGATTSGTLFQSSVSTTSATLSTNPGQWASYGTNTALVPGAFNESFGGIHMDTQLSATTTHYLVAQANFTISTMKAWGIISARRIR